MEGGLEVNLVAALSDFDPVGSLSTAGVGLKAPAWASSLRASLELAILSVEGSDT